MDTHSTPASNSPNSAHPSLSKRGSQPREASTHGQPLVHANSAEEQLRYARRIIEMESALESVSQRLDQTFCQAVDLLHRCSGSVIVSGMGKAGLVGQKIAATLASTGTREPFFAPGRSDPRRSGPHSSRRRGADALAKRRDRGNRPIVARRLPALGTPLVAITGRPTSKLARAANVVIDLGPLQEACSLGLAPSTSTTAMLAVGDALALVTSRMRGFSRDDFARFHPGGSLGRQLAQRGRLHAPLR